MQGSNRNFERRRKRRRYDDEEERKPRASIRGRRRRGRRMVRKGMCPDCGAPLVRTHGEYHCTECPGVSIGRALSV